MGKATISLDDEAYELLQAERKPGETVSEVVIRLTESPRDDDPERLAGGLGSEFASAVETSSEEVRRELEPDPVR